MHFHNLYEIVRHIQKDPGIVSFEIAFDPHHPIFQGHFPDNEILPGALLLQMLRECGSRFLGRSIVWEKVNSCKFLTPIIPTDSPLLLFEANFQKENEICATILFNSIPAAKISACYI